MVTKLVILLVIVIGVVALAQLMRVYELSSKLSQKKEYDISDRDNRLNAKLMFGFMVALFISVIWMFIRFGWTGRGDAASVHGKDLDWLLNLNLIIITMVFFLTNTLLFFFAFKYVKKPGVPALYYPHNNKLEMLWTVVPAIVLAVIIILGLRSWNNATDEAAPEAIRVELFSEQFAWTARYAGPDNVLARHDYKLTIPGKNPLALKTTATIDSAIYEMEYGSSGIHTLEEKLNDESQIIIPEEREKMEADLSRKERLIRMLYQMKARHNKEDDKFAMDDIIEDTLFLCVNKQYELNFRSKDVIHSALFPHFRVQMNTVPGAVTRFKFTPDITTTEMRKLKNDEDFNYILLCNKICGGSHYKMRMVVVVLEEGKYNKWMDLKANGRKNAADQAKYDLLPETFGEGFFHTIENAQKELEAKAAADAPAEGEGEGESESNVDQAALPEDGE